LYKESLEEVSPSDLARLKHQVKEKLQMEKQSEMMVDQNNR
jgi:hypothetical protein